MKNTTGLYKHQRDNKGKRRKLPSVEKPYKIVPVEKYEYEKARESGGEMADLGIEFNPRKRASTSAERK